MRKNFRATARCNFTLPYAAYRLFASFRFIYYFFPLSLLRFLSLSHFFLFYPFFFNTHTTTPTYLRQDNRALYPVIFHQTHAPIIQRTFFAGISILQKVEFIFLRRQIFPLPLRLVLRMNKKKAPKCGRDSLYVELIKYGSLCSAFSIFRRRHRDRRKRRRRHRRNNCRRRANLRPRPTSWCRLR